MEETREQKIKKWKLLIMERIESGMSIKKFCTEKGFSENKYQYWVKTVHKADPDFDTRGDSVCNTVTHSQEGSFVEIHQETERSVPEVSPWPSEVEERMAAAVIKAGTVEVALYLNATAPFMRELLEAVRHA